MMLQRVEQSHIDAGAHAPFLADAVDDLRQQAEDLRAQIADLDDQIAALSGSPNPARELSSGNASSLTVNYELSDTDRRQLDSLVEERMRLRDQAFELETAIEDANTSWFEKLFGQADGFKEIEMSQRRIQGANTLEDNRAAISQIQDLRSKLRDIDREAARIEQANDPNEDLPEAENAAYEALYEQAKALWRAISDIVDEYELTGESYFDVAEFESNCVADAAFNY